MESDFETIGIASSRTSTPPASNDRHRPMSAWAWLLMLFLLLGVVIAPLLIIGMNALKTTADYSANGPLAWPEAFTSQAIVAFWNRVEFGQKLFNSFLISLTVSVLALLFSLSNAFAIGIGKVRGKIIWLVIFIMANTLPQEGLAYPLYYFAKALKIYDTRISVILIFTVIQGAFGTYLLSSVFSAFPREMLEAAMLDGCNKWQLLFRIVAPASLPTLAVLFTFFFIWTWNEFFIPLIMLVSNANQTVPIAISVSQGQHNMDATMASASALLGILPCIIFFFLFQRTLTRGFTQGSVK